MAVARIRFSITINELYTRYSYEGLDLHLYYYPITIGDDYVVTGQRATDSNGAYIVGTDDGDGQYSFSDVKFGEYCIVAYKTGLLPQIVSGYSRFIIIPKFASDEIACSQTDSTILKTKINVIIQYLIDNAASLPLGTAPTLIT
jgi:hypothetical protein